MPVKDGQILSQTDIPQEMAGLLIAKSFDVLHQPLPGSSMAGKSAQSGAKGSMAEHGPGKANILRLPLVEPHPHQLLLNLAGLSRSYEALSLQPLHRPPAYSGLGLRGEKTEDQLPEEVIIAGRLPDMLKLG